MENTEDIDHLRLLSIFHYVLAGIIGLFSLFPIFHVAIGIGLLSGAFDGPEAGDSPPAMFGWIFVLIPSVIICFGLTIAILVAIAGRKLARYRSHTFCLVIAGAECMFMPIGTALGVFTIIVLLRPSVKKLFGVAEGPAEGNFD